MEMREITVGMPARSLAGHDKDACYVICRVEEDYVWLADGRLRPLEKPKKKKKKHIQIQYEIPENLQEKLQRGEALRNEDIKRGIKMLKKQWEESHVKSRCY